MHGADDFRICGDGVLLDVGVLWALIILNPRGSVLLVGGVVEGALGGSGEGVVSRPVHRGFIYNLNNILAWLPKMSTGSGVEAVKKFAKTGQSKVRI